MDAVQVDALVIGAGQAGAPLSTALARAGWKTALIERNNVGGTCINEGCTPTKTMVASARVAYLVGRSEDYGVRDGRAVVDMAEVRQRKRDIVESFRASSERRLDRMDNLELIRGDARFVAPKTVDVRFRDGSTRRIAADHVFINTGGRPTRPSLDGLDSVSWFDSTSIMEVDQSPEHLLVLGGGYVGLEFGQMFRRFGSQVTIIQRGGQLLSMEDSDVAGAVADILRQDGVDVLLDAQAIRVEPQGDGVCLTVETPDGERGVSGSHLLVATGRTPNTDTLGLDAAGVETTKAGFIRVNDRLETSAPGVYALGDVKGGPAFTHISYDDFRVIRANLLQGGSASTEGRLVPYVVFIDPQLGRIGLTEADARRQGLAIKVATLPMDHVARAVELDESRGFLKAIVDADTGQILGCAMLGIEGGELMAMIQIAMLGKVHYRQLRDGIFAHPTLSEALNNLFSRIEQA